jgi:CRISPR-associated protein Cmr5
MSDTVIEQNPLDQTRDQVYASKAYHDVETFSAEHKGQDERDAYKSMVQSLPVLVRTAGLAQALAFVKTRDGQRSTILSHLDELLHDDLGSESLLTRSRTARLGEYMYLTRQVMSALLWYKRFAEWLLDKDRAPKTTPAADDAAPAPAEGETTP